MVQKAYGDKKSQRIETAGKKSEQLKEGKPPLCMAQATLSCPFGAIHLEGRCQPNRLTEGLLHAGEIKKHFRDCNIAKQSPSQKIKDF